MSSNPKVLVAVVGVGLVGGEFVQQLRQFTPFTIVSLTAATRTLFNPAGLTFPGPATQQTAWQTELSTKGTSPDLATLTTNLAALVSPSQKVVLVDNTASEDVAKLYPAWLKAGINVITPNKKAYSGELDLYEAILAASDASGAKFLNESTVGAGLPIISTLKDLVNTGDKVTKIEGVFSGTMSYIFNEFSTGNPSGPSFSSVVSIARAKGFTEPHPGDDLNGADVARKLTILSRLIPSLRTSLPNGYRSVQTTSLVPAALSNISTGTEFMARLPEFDAHFDEMRQDAAKEGMVLRYVGVVDVRSGEIKASLEKYPVTHPFATSLGGSDNIVMFHTERYGARPLIVQGAGAGAPVTAMGVLGDLLKLAAV